MKRLIAFGLGILALGAGCSKQDNNDRCVGTNYDIQFTKNPAIGGVNNGSIAIFHPRGDTLRYQLNNGAPQANPNFTGLAPGNYVIWVINQKGCSDTTSTTIEAYGPNYAAVKQIISGYCGPCHLNGGASGGKNLDTDASIVASWDRIRIRCVNGTPTFMPQNGQLTAIDKQKITDWVNAGHRITD
ncbi:MAG: hypothetical protein ACKOC7_08040 [Sphingomonadales bacterium]